MNLTPCPCGRTTPKGQALSLADCCGPLHDGLAASDAERLMRMGAPRVRVAGNVKFDMTPAASLLA